MNRRDFICFNAGSILLQNVHANWVDVKDFGAVGDGVADDTNAFLIAIAKTNGSGGVFVPAGIYRITKPLDCSGGKVYISGCRPSYITHLKSIDTNSGQYDASVVLDELNGNSILLCDGCNLIGQDIQGVDGGDDTLKYLGNIVVLGLGGARVGINLNSTRDLIIENVTIGFFSDFGYFVRGGITTQFNSVAFVDCGWRIAGGGDYFSGAALYFCSNKDGADFARVDPSMRPTTFVYSNGFIWNRNHTITYKSGFRSIVSNGLLGGAFNSVGAYIGAYFNLSTVLLSACHFENYSISGLNAGDQKPACLYAKNSRISVVSGYYANMARATDVFVLKNVGAEVLHGYINKI